jgi:hypothetical protein
VVDWPVNTDYPGRRREHLPGDRTPKPLWLWTSNPAATGIDIDRAWQAFLRRFDLEHTFLLRGYPSLLQDVARTG